MLNLRVPGKMFLAGEYAVLLPKHFAIVCAVDKYIEFTIREHEDNFLVLNFPDYGIEKIAARFDSNLRLIFEQELSAEEIKFLKFTKIALETVYQFLRENEHTKIHYNIDLKSVSNLYSINSSGDKIKYGLGSSAAATVGLISSILALHGIDIKESKLLIYKLAAIAHYLASGKIGSCGDIAASTFGGLIKYARFNPEWLKQVLDEEKSIKEIIRSDWSKHDFHIESVDFPKKIDFLVGWVGKPISTRSKVKQFYKWFKQENNASAKICREISSAAEKFAQALNDNDWNEIKNSLENNKKAINVIEKEAEMDIETEKLRLLSKIAIENSGVGKFSGAGGGDCGFALVISDSKNSQKIIENWKSKAIEYIDIKIDQLGVRIE